MTNRKRPERVHREEGPTVRKRHGRKRASGTLAPILIVAAPSARWSVDLVQDRLGDGRRLRIFNCATCCSTRPRPSASSTLASPPPDGSPTTASAARIPRSVMRRRWPAPPNSLQWAIASARRMRSADLPVLRERSRASLTAGLGFRRMKLGGQSKAPRYLHLIDGRDPWVRPFLRPPRPGRQETGRPDQDALPGG